MFLEKDGVTQNDFWKWAWEMKINQGGIFGPACSNNEPTTYHKPERKLWRLLLLSTNRNKTPAQTKKNPSENTWKQLFLLEHKNPKQRQPEKWKSGNR